MRVPYLYRYGARVFSYSEVSETMKKTIFSRKTQKTITAWLLMAPGLILLGLFIFYPIVASLPLMFFDYSVIGDTKFVGLGNFVKMFDDHEFWSALKNSVLFVGIVPIIQILAMMLAFFVNRPIRGIKGFRTMIYLPVVTSMVAVSIIWGFLFNPNGVINTFLLEHGLIDKALGFHHSAKTAMLCVGFVTIWQGLGYYMMLYLAGIQSIPKELTDAAIVDGANVLQTMFFVNIPCLKPTIWFCTLNSVIAAVSVFDVVYVLTGGGPNNATNVLNYYSYYKAFKEFKFGYGAAVGAVQAVVVLLISLVIFAYGRKGGMNNDS